MVKKKITEYFLLARWTPFSHSIYLQTTPSSHKNKLIALQEQFSQPIFSGELKGNREEKNLIQRYIFLLKQMEAPLVKTGKWDTISEILNHDLSKVVVVV